MDKRQTAKIANSNLLSDNKLYLKRAKSTLPYLVRQARAGKTILYSDLAKELNIPNPRNLNYVLGAIGNALIKLGETSEKMIPPIQCLVVNKSTGLPGEGIGWFIDRTDFSQLTVSKKRDLINRQLANIFSFTNWDWVLKQFDLEPIPLNIQDLLKKAKELRFSGGESLEHKQFKETISNNPDLLGLKVGNGIIEYRLASADCIDILFSDKEQLFGVEVKSLISSPADILRGIFQCVKYKYLLEAEQVVSGKIPNCRIILALQGKLPFDLIAVKNMLGIEVIDEIKKK